MPISMMSSYDPLYGSDGTSERPNPSLTVFCNLFCQNAFCSLSVSGPQNSCTGHVSFAMSADITGTGQDRSFEYVSYILKRHVYILKEAQYIFESNTSMTDCEWLDLQNSH